jgi:hypothetical protein
MLFCMFAAPTALEAHSQAALPDITVDPMAWQNPAIDYMRYFVDNADSRAPGRCLLKFGTSLPNLGPGDLVLRSTAQGGPALEAVHQEVRNADRVRVYDKPITGMVYNNVSWWMDTVHWAEYRIREILPGDGVGEILRLGRKPSIRLTSSAVYDNTLPNFQPSGRILFSHANRILGISVGWTDIYDNDMDDQWVDVTGLKRGEYWLEVEVDLANDIEEADETNNIGRSKVLLNDAILPEFETHRGDTENFGVIDLPEVLRIIQLFNGGSYGCATSTEDGYRLGGELHHCQRHSSDYLEPYWTLSLSEVLRSIQLFNIGAYEPCENSEDGFCPVM